MDGSSFPGPEGAAGDSRFGCRFGVCPGEKGILQFIFHNSKEIVGIIRTQVDFSL